MTSEERLKIAEEMLQGSSGSLLAWDVGVRINKAGLWDAYLYSRKQCLDYSTTLATAKDPIECLHVARQKLAAEREAKKSEREKRLEKLLFRMVAVFEMSGMKYMYDGVTTDDARNALKED